jgi:hypothetical protein
MLVSWSGTVPTNCIGKQLEGPEGIEMEHLLSWLGGIFLVGVVAYLVARKRGST